MPTSEFGTLKLERNVARAPIWAPGSGIGLQTALDWPPAPFHGEPLTIHTLGGALTPADLLVFGHLCSRYLARHPLDRHVEVSLGDVARWLGGNNIGGEQRRAARACLARLLAATFTSKMRPGKKTSERWVHGWHLVDRWLIPEARRRVGSVWLSETVTDLLRAGSIVLLDAKVLRSLLGRSAVSARLWAYLEADTLSARRPQRYALFAAPPGEPARQRSMAAITDMLRLTDKQRRKTVLAVRRACAVIVELDPRYLLSVEHAKESGMWNLVAARRRQPVTGATWATDGGDLGNATRATWATDGGDLGNAARRKHQSEAARGVGGNRASQATLTPASDVLSQTFSPDGLLQTSLTRPKEPRNVSSPSGSTSHDDSAALVARNRSILADPSASQELRDAALAHLGQLGVDIQGEASPDTSPDDTGSQS